MKQKKVKNYLGISLFLLGFPFFLWNCETESSEPLPIQNERGVHVKSFSELPPNLMARVDFLTSRFKNRSTQGNGTLIVDESQIMEMVDSLNNTRYSVKIYFENQPENILYNLILGIDSDNNEIAPFVLKYTIDNLEEIREETYLDFAKMAGRIDDYSLDRFMQYAENYLAENRNTGVDSCNPYMGDGGGEFENPDDGTGTNDDDVDDCTINVWSNGETGDVFAITWSCSGGNSGSTTLRTADCDGGTEDLSGGGGGAGINNGDDGTNDSCPGIKVRNSQDVCVCPSGYFEHTDGTCKKEPCIGDPLPDPKVAPQTVSGIMGGMYGKTRNSNTKWHKGLDLKSDFGDPIYAMYDGTAAKRVQRDKNNNVTGAGYFVDVTSTVDGKTVNILYFHMQNENRVSGSVKAGDIIGYQGDSGNLKTAIDQNFAISHLHIKVKENGAHVDPRGYLKTNINSSGTTTNNPCGNNGSSNVN
jgi:hypothetical protein